MKNNKVEIAITEAAIKMSWNVSILLSAEMQNKEIKVIIKLDKPTKNLQIET